LFIDSSKNEYFCDEKYIVQSHFYHFTINFLFRQSQRVFFVQKDERNLCFSTFYHIVGQAFSIDKKKYKGYNYLGVVYNNFVDI